MPSLSASYSITIRVYVDPDPRTIGRITTALGNAGASVTALDVVESHPSHVVIDLTCNAGGTSHAEAVAHAVDQVEGARVHRVSDRTFLLHLGGKIAVTSKVALRTRDDLSMAYTPGVARVCEAIASHPEDARNLTIKRNTVAIVTDGSAVLGLGNLGPAAALPVMEGKAALFKQFAGVDAWPVCLDTQDVDEIVRTVEIIAPVYGGINLEDIAAPRCFEVERRLRERLSIPVFHDDQHGTAIVVLAALTNALRVVGKRLEHLLIVVCGVGAAGVAIIKILLAEGATKIIACDRSGILVAGDPNLDASMAWIAEHTNSQRLSGSVQDALVGADLFIGVSGPHVLVPEDLDVMAPDAIVFALANPEPEVDLAGARQRAAIVATGRSDEPNQINNVLAFPGVFRGALDAQAAQITEAMELAAAHALADVVTDEQRGAAYIVPSVFDPQVAAAVSAAVAQAARLELPPATPASSLGLPRSGRAISFAARHHELGPHEPMPGSPS